MLKFRTLGSIELQRVEGCRIESVLHHPKRLALLAYLCSSHPPQMCRRDTLVALLWPELDEAHARGALRQELYQLRRALGAGTVCGERADAIGVSADHVWCDVREFEAALDEGRNAEALELWHGEFLPGLHLHGGEFERWLDEVRDRLSRRTVEAARQLVADAEAAGDVAAAIGWAHRLTDLAPWDETGWQRLMMLLDRQGDRGGALRAFDTLARRLRTELEVDPSAETRALMERIRDRNRAFTASKPFVDADGPRADQDTPDAERELQQVPAHHAWAAPNQRVIIGLQPVENQTGDSALDALARRITDRLAQGLAGIIFADVAPNADARGVTAVVSATMYSCGEQIEIVPRLSRPAPDGRLIEMPRSVRLPLDASAEILDVLTAHVLVSVAAHYDPRFDAAATREGALPIRTPLWEAFLEYLQGSELFGRGRFQEGYRHLRRAYEIDPGFVKAGIFAAISLAASGEPAAADALGTEVMATGQPLGEYERTLGEWFLADLHGNRSGAYRASLEGTTTSSTPVMAALAGREALRMNRPREALRRLDGLDMQHGWWRHLTDVFDWVSSAHHVLGNHRAELANVIEGRARFPSSLDLIRTELRARAALGQPDRSLRLVEEALTFSAGPTSPADVAWAAAQELATHGNQPAAARARHAALEWLNQCPRPSTSELQLKVRLLLETNNVSGAARALEELGSVRDLASLELAGLTAARAGDAAAARQIVTQLEALQNPYLSGRHLLAAAGIRVLLDPMEVTIATLRRAFAEGLPFGVELHALPILQPLANADEFRRLLRPRD
jgi:DNA-binding SARP family transcriptional activator